ncbi:hypothetical protein FUAX_13360 [Fulvitalea axinellae]|uniref:MORN repeat variant n=1 Tax=Fulvitalea axinellae TaxID=1182444 RepID=A0AAU9CR40_9BACT|nr:hypothetical protein FUAX_13360 [Fulvitalea axinellae]
MRKLLFCLFALGLSATSLYADECKGKTVEGKKEGTWVCFYENGKKREEGAYKTDVKVGAWKYFHENGTVAMEGNYIKGVEKGKWKMFDEAGKLLEEIDYGK